MNRFWEEIKETDKKVGLVLEGGAMRAMYSAGVLDVFMEHGIEFDGIIGVSAGALFGINYLSKQPGRIIRFSKQYNKSSEYMGILNLIQTKNIINPEFAYEKAQKEIDPFDEETFIENQKTVPFYAVVTNIGKGQPEYIRINSAFEQVDVLRASSSMPFVSQPIEIGTQTYLDGGISDSIPFQKMYELGYEKLVVVMTKPYEFKRKPMNGVLTRVVYGKKCPEFSKLLLERHIMYNNQLKLLKEYEKQGIASVIRPSRKCKVSRMEKDPKKLEELYQLGKHDAYQWLR